MSSSFDSGWSIYDDYTTSDADHQRSPADGCRSPPIISPLTILHTETRSSPSNNPPQSSDAIHGAVIVQPPSQTRYASHQFDSHWGSPPSTPSPVSPYAWLELESRDTWNQCISPSSRYWTSKDPLEWSRCTVYSSLYSSCQSPRLSAPPGSATPFLVQDCAQTTWDGTFGAEQPQTISSCTERRSAPTHGELSPSVHSGVVADPGPRIKCTIKAPPILLAQLPELRSPSIKPVVNDVSLSQAQEASRVAGLICICGMRLQKQGFGTTRDLTRSHGAEGHPLSRHGSMTSSCPRCRGVNGPGHSSSYHPRRNSALSANESPHIRDASIPIHLRVAPAYPHDDLYDDPHVTERDRFRTAHSASGGIDTVDAPPTSQPQAIRLDQDVDAGEHSSTTNDSLHLPGPTATAVTPRTPIDREDPPLPAQDDHHHTRTPPTHRDAADVFLGVTQRSSGRRSNIEDSLERGMIRSQFEVDDLLPWLDINAFGPRTKAIIVALVLGIVLLGAVAKLSQAIQPQSNAH